MKKKSKIINEIELNEEDEGEKENKLCLNAPIVTSDVEMKLNEKTIKEFKTLIVNANSYSLEDLVAISIKEASNEQYGKIKKIMKIEDFSGNVNILFQLQLYFTRDDLKLDNKALLKAAVSDFELFEPIHSNRILLDITMIKNKCTLVSIEDFDAMPDKDETIYYTRAKYDNKKKILIPPIEKWRTICHCKRVWNPDDPFIQCDKCNEWYHRKCMNIADRVFKKISEENMEFVCNFCKQPTVLNQHLN